MKKIWKIIIALSLCILLAVMALAVKAALFPAAASIPEEVALHGGKNISPGETKEFSMQIGLPLNVKITDGRVEGDGIVDAGVHFERKKWHLDHAVWHVHGKFRSLKTGKISGVEVKVNTKSFPGGKSGEYTCSVPEFESILPEELVSGGELFLSPEMESEVLADELSGADDTPFYRHWLFWTGIALFLAAAVGIPLWLSARNNGDTVLPLDERILAAIRRICREVNEKRLSPERGIAELNDVVRNYLEERFKIPAARRTTPEFIRDMAVDHRLSREEKIFLTGFMENTDMVKFAGASAGTGMVENAAFEAEKLVRQNSAAEEAK